MVFQKQLEVIADLSSQQLSRQLENIHYLKKYGFSIVTSSPKYSQSNGFIESRVKNFKKHFEKSVDEDPYLMMLVLRTTPSENGYSLAELLMGRKIRTN
ncbi:hypothetical protein AVEN_184736-1 [Araneus ventricosus]|uniref:Integrase catalytic domain-containing protein n=1 Tax=Araneus ventricosus TaxID=182803 RepID=A0A4Y2L9L9_ARAVE|nr:hypothetical protein AVEN_184736-1 [Araneus ventricosus]